MAETDATLAADTEPDPDPDPDLAAARRQVALLTQQLHDLTAERDDLRGKLDQAHSDLQNERFSVAFADQARRAGLPDDRLEAARKLFPLDPPRNADGSLDLARFALDFDAFRASYPFLFAPMNPVTPAVPAASPPPPIPPPAPGGGRGASAVPPASVTDRINQEWSARGRAGLPPGRI